jgi:hypothetical protein
MIDPANSRADFIMNPPAEPIGPDASGNFSGLSPERLAQLSRRRTKRPTPAKAENAAPPTDSDVSQGKPVDDERKAAHRREVAKAKKIAAQMLREAIKKIENE